VQTAACAQVQTPAAQFFYRIFTRAGSFYSEKAILFCTQQHKKGGSNMEYHSRLQSKLNDELFDAILSLRSREECYRFFEDLCSVSELQAMAQRLEVARMLAEDITYIDIARLTGASTATISRINRCLKYGAEGYRIALERSGTDGSPADKQTNK
jgi:TrpR family protein YerC/YecD